MWTTDDRDGTEALGEVVRSPHSYSNGLSRGPVPAAGLLGSADCIANGETFPLALPVTIVDGFNVKCYQFARPLPVEPLPFQFDVRDCRTIKNLAHLCALSYFNGDGFQLAAAIDFPGCVVTRVYNVDNYPIPGTGILTIEDHTIVVISGTSNALQWALQGFYGAAGIESFGQYSTLRLWNQAAMAIEQRIVIAGGNPTGPIVFVGHSYGGAVASILAARYRIAQPGRSVSLLTFGQPKPGDGRLIRLIESTQHLHFVNVDDPVTFLPPDLAQFSGTLGLLDSLTINRWSAYRMPSDRVGLTLDGNRTDNPNAGDLYGLVFRMILQALHGQWPDAITSHNISEYERRIRCAGDPAPSPVPPCGPVAWYRPDSLYGYADGAVVEQWLDDSRNQSPARQRPTLRPSVLVRDGINGLPAVLISQQAFLAVDRLELGNTCTLYVLAKVQGTLLRPSGPWITSETDLAGGMPAVGPADVVYADTVNSGFAANSISYGQVSLWRLRRTPTLLTIHRDGVQIMTMATDPAGVLTLLGFGPYRQSSPFTASVLVAELLVLSCAVSDGEDSAWRSYFQEKYLLNQLVTESGQELLTEGGDGLLTGG